MDGFLMKPFTSAQFVKAVRLYIKDLKQDQVKIPSALSARDLTGGH